jgi:hypothetical protein
MDGPDQIGPDHRPQRSFKEKIHRGIKKFTTRYDHPQLKLHSL